MTGTYKMLVLERDEFGSMAWYLHTFFNGTLIDRYEVETCETENYKKGGV